MNEEITYNVLQEVVNSGTREFVLCPGSRNSSFVEALRLDERLAIYYFPEERSAAFFALGRSRNLLAPVAIVTTSGTASAELLPAAMEAHYSGVPLVLITADRPQKFRGSGAPQSAEQVGLFGHYVSHCFDVGSGDRLSLGKWSRKGPLHINVCLDEPQKQPKFQGRTLAIEQVKAQQEIEEDKFPKEVLTHFLDHVERPIAIVSTLAPENREAVVNLLLKLQMPVMLEGISGLRGDSRLSHLEICRTDAVLETALRNGYAIDGVLRIGGVPTHRIWRDLEYLEDSVKVCALSELHFSGLSWNRCVASGPISAILHNFHPHREFSQAGAVEWLLEEKSYAEKLVTLFSSEPYAEPSLLNQLSKHIPREAFIYLGNSLPIREWDLAADHSDKQWEIAANRGVNGIDGQISTFLGQCRPDKDNWAIIGDLTALYDLAGCWIIPQLEACKITLVIVNNGGGMIFKRMYPYREMLNEHNLSFRPLAELWGLNYQCIQKLDGTIDQSPRRLIELIPDEAATTRFWQKYTDAERERVKQSASGVVE